jgi:hypothetical protein
MTFVSHQAKNRILFPTTNALTKCTQHQKVQPVRNRISIIVYPQKQKNHNHQFGQETRLIIDNMKLYITFGSHRCCYNKHGPAREAITY